MVDHWVVVCLLPLTVWILLSGLDDLFIAMVWLFGSRRKFPWPEAGDLDGASQRPIAIFIPLWNEQRVIGQMLDRNLASVRYANYQVFAGVYPNDRLTMRAVSEAAARDPRIHVVTLPHDGPTSKGDCLNWIHRGMLDYEAGNRVRFEIVITHDAEDIIHPESLRLVNWFSRDYEMVQIPVLALPTPVRALTHGLYCDEFAEFQSKDIPVRQRLGGFLAGNGVGTGFDRNALDRLAATRGGCIFDAGCLTEDYENGFRLHALGCRQVFVPLRLEGSPPVATREYFPRALRAAVRQRSRWVAGIGLQGWQQHGWRAPARQLYWFWRDRKGMLGSLLTPLANLLFLYGLAAPWVGAGIPRWAAVLCVFTLLLSASQMALRVFTSARIYGFRFAAAVPVRMLWGNAINFLATVAAFRQFFWARAPDRRLAWRKTEHVYALPAERHGRERIGEVLIRLKVVPREVLEQAARNQPAGLRLGEYLMNLQMLSEENLYRALSCQAGIPGGPPEACEVNRRATHALPIEAAMRWNVLPYRIDLGQLHVLTADLPTEEMSRELSRLSTLELRYRLVRPSELDRMVHQYLPP